MKQILKNYIVDKSTDICFKFSVICEECGEEWKSLPVTFSKSSQTPANESKRIIYNAIYRREKAEALNRALEEAENFFNLCPIYKRFVCNDCFLICEDLDMCKTCANYLREQGEVVAKGRRMK